MILTLEIVGEQAEDFGARGRKVFHAMGGTIGRLPDNDWVFPDPYVSGRHALIRYVAGKFFVEDTSTNGVYLNSPDNRLQKSQPHALKHGDLLYIDAYRINVSIESEAGVGDTSEDTLGMLKRASASKPAAAKVPPAPAESPRAAAPIAPVKVPSAPPAARAPAIPKAPRPADETSFLPFEEDHTVGMESAQDDNKTEWIGLSSAPAMDDNKTEWIGMPSAPAMDDNKTEWIGMPNAPVMDDNKTEWIGVPNAPATDDNKTEWFSRKAIEPEPPRKPPPGRARGVAPPPPPPTAAPPAAPFVAPAPAARAAPAMPAAPVKPTPAVVAKPAPPMAASAVDPAPARERTPTREPSPAGGARNDDPMMREVLAAAGIVGVEPSVELAQTLGEILRIAVAGMMEVQRARERMKDELRVRGTIFKPAHNNPLKFSANVEDAFHNLLLKHNAAYLDPTQAFEDAFHDVRDHHSAIMVALRLAFESMLAQFDPNRMQDEFDRQMKKGSILGVPVKLRYWELYRDRYGDMVKDADTSFRHLFGDKFAVEYEEQLERLKSQGRDREK